MPLPAISKAAHGPSVSFLPAEVPRVGKKTPSSDMERTFPLISSFSLFECVSSAFSVSWSAAPTPAWWAFF